MQGVQGSEGEQEQGVREAEWQGCKWSKRQKRKRSKGPRG
jgi:hypothetical protein